jgi:hypothetical protein
MCQLLSSQRTAPWPAGSFILGVERVDPNCASNINGRCGRWICSRMSTSGPSSAIPLTCKCYMLLRMDVIFILACMAAVLMQARTAYPNSVSYICLYVFIKQLARSRGLRIINPTTPIATGDITIEDARGAVVLNKIPTTVVHVGGPNLSASPHLTGAECFALNTSQTMISCIVYSISTTLHVRVSLKHSSSPLRPARSE